MPANKNKKTFATTPIAKPETPLTEKEFLAQLGELTVMVKDGGRLYSGRIRFKETTQKGNTFVLVGYEYFGKFVEEEYNVLSVLNAYNNGRSLIA